MDRKNQELQIETMKIYLEELSHLNQSLQENNEDSMLLLEERGHKNIREVVR